MSKKELVENHRALKREFLKLESQFNNACHGAWMSAGKKDFVIPPKKTLRIHETERVQFYRSSSGFSERAWFKFGDKMNHFARSHAHPFDRWFDMIKVIDLDLKHHSVYQGKWPKAVTKPRMSAHNKMTGQIIKKLREHVDLLIEDRSKWEKLK